MTKQIKIDLSIGKCEDVLKEYEDNHFDTVITDPPYGLGDEPDPVELLRAWIHEVELKTSGGGFMNRKWDSMVPSPSQFREILRVVKPGRKSAFFAGTRTLHLMMASLRLAGWQIEDVWAWTYGSGFPKNHSVYKALKKKAKARYGDSRCHCVSEDYVYDDEYFRPEGVLDLEKEAERVLVLDDYGDHDLVTRVCSWCGQPDQGFIDSTEGLGTALKPAWEPVVVVSKRREQKPIDYRSILRSYGFNDEEIKLIMTPPGE